jgi:hypothetical protein
MGSQEGEAGAEGVEDENLAPAADLARALVTPGQAGDCSSAFSDALENAATGDQ